MSQHWKERLDPAKHLNLMVTTNWGGEPVTAAPDSLIESYAYFVRVCGFTFQFVSLAQLKEYLNYFSASIHPSSRRELVHYGVCGHWNQRWFERLPMWLLEEPKRRKVVKALEKALNEFGDG